MLLDCKLSKTNNKVVVILGDGELNEGSIWEGALVASAKKLDNLIAVVDRNKFQANLPTEDLIPIEPIDKKFEAFGWNAFHCNGHDFNDLNEVFTKLPLGEREAERYYCRYQKRERITKHRGES